MSVEKIFGARRGNFVWSLSDWVIGLLSHIAQSKVVTSDFILKSRLAFGGLSVLGGETTLLGGGRGHSKSS